MFTKICIENFKGISNKIEFDFIAKSRNREEQACLYKTHDGLYINKLIGIIAGNASGKTTIIEAICKLGRLMTGQVMEFDYDEETKRLENKFANLKISKDELEQIIDRLQKNVNIKVQNVSNLHKETYLEVEMYIDQMEFGGYYNYVLQLDGINKRISKEYFSYRKNYRSKSEEIINLTNIKECQLYYINKYYENMLELKIVDTKELTRKYNYINTFFNHYINYSKVFSIGETNFVEGISFIQFYNKNPKLMEEIVKIVDPKISAIRTKPDSDKEDLIYELNTGGYVTRENLSTGTKRFLSLIIKSIGVINARGVLLIDEIESNLHKELIFLILRLFVTLGNNSTQMLFTTNLPEIFNCMDEKEQKLFKQDAIYLLNNLDGIVKLQKMSDIRIGDRRIKGDALVSNLYKRQDIILQPDKEKINSFINKINKGLY